MSSISYRRRLLYMALAAGLVVVGAPLLIAYALGYRVIDLAALEFLETGGVYVAADRAGVTVSVDGEPRDTTSFLSHGVLVQNLLSGEYAVAVSREGFVTREKLLPVYPSLVTEWRPLLVPDPVPLRLLPEYLPATATSTATAGRPVALARNPERTSAALLFAPATTTSRAASAELAELNDFLAELDRPALATGTALRRAGNLTAWIERGVIRIAWLGDQDAVPQYFCAPSGCRLEMVVSVQGGARGFDFYPGRDDAFVVTKQGGVVAVEADGRGDEGGVRAEMPIAGQGYEARVSNDRIYVRSPQGQISEALVR